MRILLALKAILLLFQRSLSQSAKLYYEPIANFNINSTNTSKLVKTISNGRTTGTSTVILSSDTQNKAYIHEIVYTTSGSCVINPGGSYSPCLTCAFSVFLLNPNSTIGYMGQDTSGTWSTIPNIYKFDTIGNQFSSVTSVSNGVSQSVVSLVFLDGGHIVSINRMLVLSALTLSIVTKSKSSNIYASLACRNSTTCYAIDNSSLVGSLKVLKFTFNTIYAIQTTSTNSFSNYTGLPGVGLVLSYGDYIMICDKFACGFIYGSNLSLVNTTYTPGSYPGIFLNGYLDGDVGLSYLLITNPTSPSIHSEIGAYTLYPGPLVLSNRSQLVWDSQTNISSKNVKEARVGAKGQLMFMFYNPGGDGKIYVYDKAPCDPSCATCRAGVGVYSSCLKCPAGYAYTFTTLNTTYNCTPCSNPNQFMTPSGLNILCGNCSTTCATCSGTAGHCTSCPLGYYLSLINCNHCLLPCLTCSGTASNCTSCANPLMSVDPANGACITCSGSNYVSGNYCMPCHTNCSACSGTQYNCSACASGYYLNASNFSCSTCNTPGVYSQSGNCLDCDPTCLTCSSPGTFCLSCTPDKLLVISNHTCGTCPPGKFPSGAICANCDANCLNCSISSTNCTACNPSLGYSVLSTGACGTCGSGSYVSNGYCLPCDLNCATCQTTATTCSSCTGLDTLFQNFTCGTCPTTGYFVKTVGAIQYCNSCDPSCHTCSTTATKCDTCSAGFLMYPNSTCGSCSEPNYYIDSSGASCLPCDITCGSCSTIPTNCTSCNAGNFLDVNNACGPCTTPGTFQDTTLCSACDPLCSTCSGLATNCTSCPVPQKLYSNSTCGSCTEAGVYANGTLCSVCSSNCLSCIGNSLNCTACNGGWFLYPDYTCGLCSAGGMFVNGSLCSNCSSNCSTCSGLAANCTSCQTGFVLNASNVCVPCPSNTFSNGTTCPPCNSTCSTCVGSAINCTSCVSGNFMFPNNTCGACPTPGYFVNGTSCSKCDVSCATCSGTPLTCLSCPVDLTLLPTNSTCVDAIYINISAVLNPQPLQSVDYSLLLYTTSPDITDSNLIRMVASSLIANLTFTPQKTPTVAEVVVAKFTILPSTGTNMILDAVLSESLAEKEYFIGFNNSGRTNFKYNNSSYAILPYNFTFNYTNPKASKQEVQAAQSQGQVLGALVSVVPVSSPAALDTFNTVTAMDPSGLLMKFSQIIRIFNKLYYLNINFGERLGAFLKQIEQFSSTKTEQVTETYMETSKLGYRGKLSRRVVILDSVGFLGWKILVYMLIWLLNFGVSFVIRNQPKVGKIPLIALYLIPRLHLVVFNVVIMDFCFYSAHTYLHFSGWYSTLVSAACLFLLSIDLLKLIDLALSTRPWRTFYNAYRALNPVATKNPILKHLNETNGDLSDSSSLDLAKPAEPPTKGATPQPVVAPEPINYRRTYQNISDNFHVIELLCCNISCDSKVYSIQIAKCFMIMHFVRIGAYQLLITVGQYASGLIIISLLCLEVSKVTITIYSQMKYRIFSSKIVFLLEISQSLFLSLFMLICTYLDTLKMNDIVNETLQTIGIGLVFASVIIEYILILCDVVILIHDLIKEKREQKRRIQEYKRRKMVVPSEPSIFSWFIIYGAEPEIPQISDPKMQGELNNNMNSNLDNPDNLKPKKKGMIVRNPVIRKRISAKINSIFGDRFSNLSKLRKNQILGKPLAQGTTKPFDTPEGERPIPTTIDANTLNSVHNSGAKPSIHVGEPQSSSHKAKAKHSKKGTPSTRVSRFAPGQNFESPLGLESQQPRSLAPINPRRLRPRKKSKVPQETVHRNGGSGGEAENHGNGSLNSLSRAV